MASENDRIRALEIGLAVMGERQKGAKRALNLQAVETNRRLGELNGEASRLREMQVQYVPREVWDNQHEDLQKQVKELKTYKDTQSGRQAVFAFIIPAVISIAVVLLGHFLK